MLSFFLMRKFGLIVCFLFSINLYSFEVNLSCDLDYRTVCLDKDCKTYRVYEDDNIQPRTVGISLVGSGNSAVLTIDEVKIVVEKKGNEFSHTYKDVEFGYGQGTFMGDISTILNIVSRKLYITRDNIQGDNVMFNTEDVSSCTEVTNLLD